MLPTTPESLLPIVLDAMSRQPARGRELVGALTALLHRFVLEHHVTEAEFEYAVDFVVRIGQATNASHNEGVLVADLLGLSQLVALLNNAQANGESDATLLGPFWRAHAPHLPSGATIAAPGTPGMLLEVHGHVVGAAGEPVAGATVDVWQASPAGLYENQDEAQPDMNLRGRFETDAEGAFFFRSVRPAGYAVPTSGPGGDLLRAQHRHPNRPAHLHFMVSKPGFKVLVTQVFADDSENLESDPTFGVTQRLVGHFEVVEPARSGMPNGEGRGLARLTQRLTLIPGEMVLPKAPIS
jgi:catechol 1,2-dioxygenase